MNNLKRNTLFTLVFMVALFIGNPSHAQLKLSGGQEPTIDYANPIKYEIGGIVVSGTQFLDPNAILLISGLAVGETIEVPGPKISEAIQNLWDQGLFSTVDVRYQRIQGGKIFLEVYIEEQPRLSRYSFRGVSKSEADKIREEVNLYREKIVTKNLLLTTENTVREFFIDKGYLNADVEVVQKADTLIANHVELRIIVRKNEKVKINEIIIRGNTLFSDRKLRKQLDETKDKSRFRPFYKLDEYLKNMISSLWRGKNDTVTSITKSYFEDRIRLRVFKSSRYIKSDFQADLKNIIAAYNAEGYRDAKIVFDTVYDYNEKLVNIEIEIDEGNRYYFRNIEWIGNSIYTTSQLNAVLGINKGDVYSPDILDMRLFMNQNGLDVSSLYMDDGYLFFDVNPVEKQIINDSIDLEIRIREGQQARVNQVIIRGNTKTKEHVIRREVKTRPGDLFSRADIIRTQRELSLLGYFDPQAMNVVPKPNPVDGTVDIEYQVQERPNDQIELSGGFGGGRIVGTLGVSFNNFSTKNFFKKESWRPLPSGDGQRLSLRAQTNGAFFQSYNISFTEPWLGGKRPNALSVSAYYSIQSNGLNRGDANRQSIDIFGVSVGLGKRLRAPDDNFTLYLEGSFQNYNVQQWNAFRDFSNGHANNIFGKAVFGRSSINDLNFPTSGSKTTVTLQATPPYSLVNNKDYENLSTQEKFKFIEYHKWKFTSEWYNTLAGKERKVVLFTKVGFGTLGSYNSEVGFAPFERFYLGGSGLTGFALDGREIIALRGYDDQSLSPITNGAATGGTIINKYTAELRFPFTLNPQAMVYALAFAEAGNTWDSYIDYNPFAVKRSAGVGIRIFLPMFGLLGLDYGYRFDDVASRPGMQRSQIHFTIGANLGEL